MAQQVIVELVDDLDGSLSDDISSVTFGLDGVEYEIVFTEANATRLREALADYAAAGRRTGGRVKRGTPSSRLGARPPANREQTKAIREWARKNGYELAERGRIPGTVIAAYEEAQAAAAKTKARGGRRKASQ
jgi:hypothetical protein